MKKLMLLLLVLEAVNGCSQSYGPGYEFSLFKNTVNWELAQAVERENVAQIKKILENDTVVQINLRESLRGQTLLNLAVGNDKPVSTRLLLDYGADYKISSASGFAPIHTAATLIGSRKHSAEIIKILLEHGADPNAVAIINKNNPAKYVPLMAAVVNFECSKILIEHGANVYYKDSLDYPVWTSMLVQDGKTSESIFVAKYLIVDRKQAAPNPVFYTIPNNIPRSASFLIRKFDTNGDIQKQKARDEILKTLK